MYSFSDKFYSDVRVEDCFETTVTYKNGELENCKIRQVKRAFIRVFDGKMWYYSSTTELSKIQDELDSLYKEGIPCANIFENAIVKKFQKNVCEQKVFKENCVRNVDIEKKKELVKACLGLFSAEEVKYLSTSYNDVNNNYEFYSSLGASIKYDYQICGVKAMYALSDGKENFQNGVQTTSDSFGELEYKKLFTEELERSIDFLHRAKPCEKGDFPVILAPTVAGVFAHESFGHKSEADFMVGDETMRKEWQIGKKVGSDILTICDSGVVHGSGYVPFDDEGTKAGKTFLVKNGILSGRLHSAMTAADLGEEVTGNARAMNGKFEPIVRMTTTFIEKGSSTLDELVAGVKKGYFIYDCSHGSGMSRFTIAPTISYEIIDGKIGDPVKISVLTGDVFKTLDLIDGLSDKVVIFSSIGGGCGKMEQFPLHVAFGGPYVRISSLNIN